MMTSSVLIATGTSNLMVRCVCGYRNKHNMESSYNYIKWLDSECLEFGLAHDCPLCCQWPLLTSLIRPVCFWQVFAPGAHSVPYVTLRCSLQWSKHNTAAVGADTCNYLTHITYDVRKKGKPFSIKHSWMQHVERSVVCSVLSGQCRRIVGQIATH